jgi:hypothetical protein
MYIKGEGNVLHGSFHWVESNAPAKTINLNFIKMKAVRNFEHYEFIVQKYGINFKKSYEYLSSTSVDRIKMRVVCNKIINKTWN